MNNSTSNNNICLLSGGYYKTDRLERKLSRINHKCYADKHCFDYFSINKCYPNMQNPYFFKIAVIQEMLPQYEWVVWMDDDTYFTNFQLSVFSEIIASVKDKWLIIADSPISLNRKSPIVNSGVMLIKNVPEAIGFLNDVYVTPLEQIKASYDESKYGFWTNTDQDSIIYFCDKRKWNDVEIIDHNVMNSRIYEYHKSIDEHFILHLPGVKDKLLALNSFAKKYDCDISLIPKDIINSMNITFSQRLITLQIIVRRLQMQYRRFTEKIIFGFRRIKNIINN